MFCQKCGKEIKEGVKFCSSCGSKVEEISEVKKKNIPVKTEEKKTNNSKVVIDQIITFVSIIMGFIIGKYLGLVIFVFIFAWAIGQWFPKWYLKRKHVNLTLIKWISWSNVVTWLLPPLGVMTGFATLGFANDFSKDSKKYRTLSIISLVASFLNALSGILMNI